MIEIIGTVLSIISATLLQKTGIYWNYRNSALYYTCHASSKNWYLCPSICIYIQNWNLRSDFQFHFWHQKAIRFRRMVAVPPYGIFMLQKLYKSSFSRTSGNAELNQLLLPSRAILDFDNRLECCSDGFSVHVLTTAYTEQNLCTRHARHLCQRLSQFVSNL